MKKLILFSTPFHESFNAMKEVRTKYSASISCSLIDAFEDEDLRVEYEVGYNDFPTIVFEENDIEYARYTGSGYEVREGNQYVDNTPNDQTGEGSSITNLEVIETFIENNL